MNLTQLKEYFHQQLKDNNPAAEIDSIFDLLAEKYFEPDQSKVEHNYDKEIDPARDDKFIKALERLKKDEPIQYILEEARFYGRLFKVNSHVHVPRPESETIVNWVLEDFKSTNNPLSLLDIGTGCGLLAISLAKELPEVNASAMDISEKALDVARENADQNQAEISFIQADVLQLESLPSKYDILVSNPPYIFEIQQRDVQRRILKHEPAVALYVKDNDPMIFNRKIAELAKKGLSQKGKVYVEINQYLGKETEQLFQENGFETELRRDVFGNIRTLKANRKD